MDVRSLLCFFNDFDRLALAMVNWSIQITDLRVYVSDCDSNLLIFMVQNVNFRVVQPFSFLIKVFNIFESRFVLLKLFYQMIVVLDTDAFLLGFTHQLIQSVILIWNFSFKLFKGRGQFLNSLISLLFVFFCLDQDSLQMVDILGIPLLWLLTCQLLSFCVDLPLYDHDLLCCFFYQYFLFLNLLLENKLILLLFQLSLSAVEFIKILFHDFDRSLAWLFLYFQFSDFFLQRKMFFKALVFQ